MSPYWLCMVTNCDSQPQLQEPVEGLAGLDSHEVTKVSHYYLAVDAVIRRMRMGEDRAPYGGLKE